MSDEQKKMFEYWVSSANDDWETAEILLDKKRYVPALFFIHLSLEKLIKALIIKKNKAPDFIHNLRRLYEQIGIVPEKYIPWLNEISTFNISARYDVEKNTLYKKANDEFTNEWHQKARKIRQWLKQQLN